MPKFQFCPFCGKKLTKKAIHGVRRDNCSCGYINYNNSRPTASMVIYNDKKEILLVKRSIKPFFGLWSLPGGFLEPNEHPEVGVMREMKEEIGVTMKLEKLLGVHMDHYNDPQQGFYYTMNFGYLVKYRDQKLTAADDASEVKFFPINKLPKICFKCDREAVRDAIKYLKNHS